jgi:hypothetical protein
VNLNKEDITTIECESQLVIENFKVGFYSSSGFCELKIPGVCRRESGGLPQVLLTDQGTDFFQLAGAAQLFVLMGDELGILAHEHFSNQAQVKIIRMLQEVFPVNARPHQAPVSVDVDLRNSQFGCPFELVSVHTLGAFQVAAGFVDAFHFFLGHRAGSVNDSGMSYSTGRITKAGWRDLRRAMVDASNHAIMDHAHWRAQFEGMCAHIGRSKSLVAIARKLLVVVWPVLTKEVANNKANPTQVACSLFANAHKVRVKNLPKDQSPLGFIRNQLDRLKIGQEVRQIPWGSKTFKLPESKLPVK